MSDASTVNVKAAVEAVLFATGSAVEKDKLCKALGSEEKPYNKKELELLVKDMMAGMMQKTEESDSSKLETSISSALRMSIMIFCPA